MRAVARASTEPTAIPPPPPRLSPSISDLLTTLCGAVADEAARLHVDARTIDGIGQYALELPVGSRHEFIDDGLLELLEHKRWAVHLALAIRSGDGQTAIRVHALMASKAFNLVFRGSKWTLPTEDIAAARQRFDGFSIEPTIVIFGGTPVGGGGYTLTAIFGLSQPLDVRTRDDEERVLGLLRRLARALGTDAPADDQRVKDLCVPLPGSTIRERSGRDMVLCLESDPVAHYPVSAIEVALQKEST